MLSAFLKTIKIEYILLILGLSVLYYFISLQYYSIGAYHQINLLFDYDIPWYFEALGQPWHHDSVWIKHPLIYLFSLPVSLLSSVGLKPDNAVILFASIANAATVVVLWSIAQSIGVSKFHALLIALMYAFSPLIFILSGMPEAYTLVTFPVTLMWLFLIRAVIHNRPVKPLYRAIAGIAAAGTTSFFIVLFALHELALYLHLLGRRPVFRDFFDRRLWLGSIYFGVVFLGLMAIVYLPYMDLTIDNSVQMVKKTAWAIIQVGDKAGPLSLFHSFYLAPLLPPELSIFVVNEKETILDFRTVNHEFWHWPVFALFLSGLFFAIYRAFKEQDCRLWLVIIILTWLLFTFMFHLQYQYRGSTFIYTPHHWSTIFILLSVSVYYLQKTAKAKHLVLPVLFIFLVACIVQSVRSTSQIWQKVEQVNLLSVNDIDNREK